MLFDLSMSISKLQSHIELENYKGHDPYDALLSPFFKLPVLKSNKFIRFGTQQLVKRLPLNLRPLLLVPKSVNPVTLGLAIQAYANLCYHYPSLKEYYKNKINDLIDQLEILIPKGFSGACWGYNFDWEARNAKIPAFQPTIVATGIITNALFIALGILGIAKARDLIISASNFVLHDLNRTFEGQSFCYSYSPFDNQKVFNASMKGARLLAQAFSITNQTNLKDAAKSAIDFVVSYQQEDGSWYYSLAKAGGWIDNYHTGYVLDCMHEYQRLTTDTAYLNNLTKGYNFYVTNLFDEDGFPFFYNNNKYPLDCTAASQAILTHLRFGNQEMARKVARFTIGRMQKKNGSFKFREYKSYTINTSFMRWSDAWMFAALTSIKN
jgi:hypothetical protein